MTTNPAAKLSRYGSTGTTSPESSTVRMAARGSTAPERVPSRNALPLPIPEERSGREIIAPSGKFWIAMPRESASAEAARSRINYAGLSGKYGSGFADFAAEVTAEGMAGAFTLTTDGRTLSAEEISSVFSRVDYSAVSHVADYISVKSGIRNLKAYLRSALLYRAVGELSQKPTPAKRDYDEQLW